MVTILLHKTKTCIPIGGLSSSMFPKGYIIEYLENSVSNNKTFDKSLHSEIGQFIIVSVGWPTQTIIRKYAGIPLIVFIENLQQLEEVNTCPDLFKIVITNPAIFNRISHLPASLIENIPIFSLSYSRKEKSEKYHPKSSSKNSIVFISPSSEELSISRRMLFFFNQMKNLDITIIVSKSIISVLKQNANPNITVLSKDFTMEPSFLNEYNLIIASEHWAKFSVLMGRPVIVAGACGFEGIVSEINIRGLLEFDFAGRVGGDKGEDIPIPLLKYEIDRFFKNNSKENVSIAKAAQKNMCQIFNDSVARKYLAKLLSEVKVASQIYQSPISERIRYLISNKNSFQKWGRTDGFYVVNSFTGQVLGFLTNKEYQILSAFNQLTPKKIEVQFELDSEEFKGFILDLWRSKILLISSN